MKKTFITAIALLAISSASMANNAPVRISKSVKEIVTTETSTVKVAVQKEEVVLVSKTCEQAGARAFVQAVLADVPLEGAYNLAFAVRALCESLL